MKRKLALLLVVLIVLAGQLFSSDVVNQFTTVNVLGLRTPSMYDIGVNWFGYLWGNADGEDSPSQSLFDMLFGGDDDSFTPSEYQPKRMVRPFNDAAGIGMLVPGKLGEDSVASPYSSASEVYHTMGLHAALDYAVRLDKVETGGNYSPQEYSRVTNQVQLYLGMSFRQRLMDQVFIYEHAGLETGYGTISYTGARAGDYGPHIIFGAYADVGVAYMPIAGLTVTAGARLELGMEYSTEFEIDTVIYAGVGYGF